MDTSNGTLYTISDAGEPNWEVDKQCAGDSLVVHNTVNCGLLTINNHVFSVQCANMIPPNINMRKCRKQKQNKLPVATGKKAKPEEAISICVANSRYAVITAVSKEFGWNIVRDKDTWNIFWTDSHLTVEFCRSLRRFQKVNHFPGMFEICRKDLLSRNMNRMLKLFPKDYDIFPKTWQLPTDLGEVTKHIKRSKNRTYILKPDSGAQGRGIMLIKNLKDIKPNEHMVCQLYISKPLLIDGFKFDLRVYSLITSVDPLRIYIYNEGLARFATSPYSEPKGHNTTNMYMHLTNYSVNKHSRTYCKDNEAGSKRTFSTINRILSSVGYDVVSMWNNIDDVVIKAILSAWPTLKHNYNASFPTHDITQACFEILGIDIIIDQNLKPWLLEINHSPSFHLDGHVDEEVKYPLICDTFNMLNINSMDKKHVMDEDRKRINDRLLKKIKEMQSRTEQIIDSCKGDISPKERKPYRSYWVEQIEWEETHMGGFRRVLPAPGDSNRYEKFFDHENRGSVLRETVTSKRRVEAAQNLRIAIAEKEKFPIPMKMTKAFAKTEETYLSEIRKIKKYRPPIICNGFHMEGISQSEERERLALMAQRDFIVRSCDILNFIYAGFYHNNLLSGTDLKEYEELIKSENSSFELLHHERRLCLKSLTTNNDNIEVDESLKT